MDALRALGISITVIDNATDCIKETVSFIEDLLSRDFSLVVGADLSELEDLKDSIFDNQDIIEKTTDSATDLGNELEKSAEKGTNAFGKLADGFSDLQKLIAVGSSMALMRMTQDTIFSLEQEKAAYASLDDYLGNVHAQRALDYLKTQQGERGDIQAQMMANLAGRGFRDPDELIRMAQSWEKVKTSDIYFQLQQMGFSSPEQLAQISQQALLGGGGSRLQARLGGLMPSLFEEDALEKKMAELAARPEMAAQIQAGTMGQQQLQRLAIDELIGQAFEEMGQKASKSQNTYLKNMYEFNLALADLKDEVFTNLLPLFKEVIKGLTALIRSVPPEVATIGAVFIGIAAGLAGLASALSLLGPIISMISMLGGLLAGGGLSLGVAGALTNPVTAVLLLVGAITLLLWHMGVLQEAWNKFSNSELGGDILEGLQKISNWLATEGIKNLEEYIWFMANIYGKLFEVIDWGYSRLKDQGNLQNIFMPMLTANMGELVINKMANAIDTGNDLAKSHLEFMRDWGGKILSTIDYIKTALEPINNLKTGAEEYISDLRKLIPDFSWPLLPEFSWPEIPEINFGDINTSILDFLTNDPFGKLQSSIQDFIDWLKEKLGMGESEVSNLSPVHGYPNVFQSPAGDYGFVNMNQFYGGYASPEAAKEGSKGDRPSNEDGKKVSSEKSFTGNLLFGTTTEENEFMKTTTTRTPGATLTEATNKQTGETKTYIQTGESVADIDVVQPKTPPTFGEALSGMTNMVTGGLIGTPLKQSEVGSEILTKGLLIGDPGEEILPADLRMRADTPVRRLLNVLAASGTIRNEEYNEQVSNSTNRVVIDLNLTVKGSINGIDTGKDLERQLVKAISSHQIQEMIKEAAAHGYHRGARSYRG